MNPKTLRYGFITLLLFLAGCAKKEDKPVTVVVDPNQPAVALVKADEQSRHFLAVSRQLELGGTLYGYVDVDGDARKLATGMQSALTQMAASQPMLAPYAKQDLGEIFHLLGFDDIKAMGVSSVPDGHGLFRNRAFFYTPEGRHGLLAGLGGKAAPFAYVELAPADTDVYAETEMDLPVLYQTVKQVIAKVAGEPASSQVDTALQRAGDAMSLSVLSLIQGLKGHAAMVVRLEKQKNLQWPPGGQGGVTVPAFSVLICVDGVAPVIEPMLNKAGAGFKFTKTATQRVYELAQPLPLPDLNPVIVLEGQTLYFATTRAFLDECQEQKVGLAQTPEFRAALAQVGTEGNALAYIHPRFFARLRQIEALNPTLPPEVRSIVHTVVSSLPTPPQPLVSVRTNLPDGILVRSSWNRSLKQDLAMISVYNPITVGLLAAMAIPAFQKVRTASQQKAVMNNLRLFAAAGEQFCLESGINRAGYNNIVGPDKMIKALIPVAGENYRGLVYVQGQTLRVRLANGQVVEYRP